MRRLGQHSLGLLALTSAASLMLGCSHQSEVARAPSSEARQTAQPGYAGSVTASDSAPSDMAASEEADEPASDMPSPPPEAAPAKPAAASLAASGGAAPSTPGRVRRESKKGEVARDGSSRRPAELATASGVRAGEWDDNANYREFQRWLSTQDGIGFHAANVSRRRFIVVSDSQGKAVPGCKVAITDEHQKSVSLTTQTSGRALLFPMAEGLRGQSLVATTSCQGQRASMRFSMSAPDGVVKLSLPTARKLPAKRTIDIAFVLDTTGSMSEEIASIKETIRAVSKQLDTGNIDVRIAMVDFKDRTDSYVTKVRPFTTDIAGFARSVDGIQASGGGDTPESVNEGLSVALTQLDWKQDSVGRFAFLVGDAPPHLDYQDTSYTSSMQRANHDGIQIFTIAASGMDDLGQVVWRQIAQYTGGTNLFVLRGGAGPQSTGAGDAKSSCGGTHTNYASGNLDTLIVQKVQRELKALDSDPMRIAGLGQDERAKPCAERLVMAN